MSNPIVSVAVSRLKYPWLLALTGTVLVVDLLVPDFLPFVDEIILAALTTLFASWRERKAVAPAPGAAVAKIPPPIR